MEPFVAHGYYTLSNTMSYLVQLNESCDGARLKIGNRITDWMEIEWVENEDNPEMTDPVLDPKGYNVPFDLVMRIDR